MALTDRELQFRHRRTKKGTISNKYQMCKKSAKIRNLDIDIDTKYLTELWDKQEGKCALTGAELGYTGTGWNVASVDRIDSTKGYVRDNVQWTCWRANEAKSNMSNNDFLNFCATITFKHFNKK